jgi:hypothetical protein
MGSENISHGNVKNGGDIHVQSTFDRDDDPQYRTLVKTKYRGTVSDQREMSALGRAQVLRVRMRRPPINQSPQMTMCRGTFDSSPSSALHVVCLALGNLF